MTTTTVSRRRRRRPTVALTQDQAEQERCAFTCRLRSDLQARVDEARWKLRLPSRTATIVRAIEEFLARHQVA